MKRVLITGGAGFIGTALVRHLAEFGGYQMTVMDNLSPQIHGQNPRFSEALLRQAKCVRADVQHCDDWDCVFGDNEFVVHLAAETGTGQSMYEISRYTSVNVDGTALLLEQCGRDGPQVRKVVLASSRAIYGEGKYSCQTCGVVYPDSRDREAMLEGFFDVHCPACGATVEPLASDELTPMKPVSIYGLTKACQEQLVTVWGPSREVETVALRFQNVYGPGQSLSNPYTGILSIFSSLILDGRELDIFEDGRESRDFVYVDDAAESIRLAIEVEQAPRRSYNVGTGKAVSISEVAELLMGRLGRRVPVSVSGHFRAGDIRHNFACTHRSEKDLGFEPKWALEDGIARFCHWVAESGGGSGDHGLAARQLSAHNLLLRGKVTGN